MKPETLTLRCPTCPKLQHSDFTIIDHDEDDGNDYLSLKCETCGQDFTLYWWRDE